MKKIIVSRIALVLMSVGLIVLSLAPNSVVSAQKPCQDSEGWTTIDGTEIDLSGGWNLLKSTDCKNGWFWTRAITISEEDGKYIAKIGDEPPMTVKLDSSGIVFERDLSWFGAGKDKNGVSLQTWRGVVQKDEEGRIRIYGKWSGAYEYLATDEKYNLDFKMMKDK